MSKCCHGKVRHSRHHLLFEGVSSRPSCKLDNPTFVIWISILAVIHHCLIISCDVEFVTAGFAWREVRVQSLSVVVPDLVRSFKFAKNGT